MMLEQEIASIMRFCLDAADNPQPYYYDVPEDFQVPAMYFPQPEIDTAGETFLTYAFKYSWYINIFCSTTEDAHALAWQVLTAIKQARNLIPLLDDEGEDSGSGLRINDPRLVRVDTGVVQIVLTWTSRRPYDLKSNQEGEKMVYWEAKGWLRPDIYNTVSVEAAYESAVTAVTMDYPSASEEGVSGVYPDSE